MKRKVMIDRETPVADSWHLCRMYQDSLKTVFCIRCRNKEYSNKRKLARLQLTNRSTQ